MANAQKLSYDALRTRVDNLSKLMTDNARILCREAGLDPSLLGIHPHNAMVSLHYGKPWPEVNYSKCRATIRQMDRAFIPSQLLTSLYKRGRTHFSFEKA
jgi:hypothetical protein